MLNFQGIKEDNLRTFFSNGPGFFERQITSKDLIESERIWSDLDLATRNRLVELKWDQDSWDGRKEFPDTTKIAFDKLKGSQKIAANHLGILRENWKKVWEEREKKMKKHEE